MPVPVGNTQQQFSAKGSGEGNAVPLRMAQSPPKNKSMWNWSGLS